jgi:hypothetical protein
MGSERLTSNSCNTPLVTPIDGDIEEIRQQGEDLMHRAYTDAIRLDSLRR